MKRLLVRNEYGGIDRVCEKANCYGCDEKTRCNARIFEKLVSYEETGMEPAELYEIAALWNSIPPYLRADLIKQYGGKNNGNDL